MEARVFRNNKASLRIAAAALILLGVVLVVFAVWRSPSSRFAESAPVAIGFGVLGLLLCSVGTATAFMAVHERWEVGPSHLTHFAWLGKPKMALQLEGLVDCRIVKRSVHENGTYDVWQVRGKEGSINFSSEVPRFLDLIEALDPYFERKPYEVKAPAQAPAATAVYRLKGVPLRIFVGLNLMILLTTLFLITIFSQSDLAGGFALLVCLVLAILAIAQGHIWLELKNVRYALEKGELSYTDWRGKEKVRLPLREVRSFTFDLRRDGVIRTSAGEIPVAQGLKNLEEFAQALAFAGIQGKLIDTD